MSEFARFVRHCVAQVWGDGVFRGSGFFVAPGRLVTCAHVVGEGELSVVVNGIPVAARLVRRVPERHDGGAYYPLPDLAVLELAEDVPHEVVWLGEPDAVLGGGALVEATGFTAETPNGVGEHVARLSVAGPSGDFLRLAGDWIPAGLSGAPVVDETSRRVCGLIKASRDRQATEGGWMVPVAELARLAEVDVEANLSARGGWWSLATRRAELAQELFGVAAQGIPRAPSAWLDPQRGVIEFQPRPEFDELMTWALDPQAPPVLLVHGPGGIGKTRLAVELCAQLAQRGWIAGLLPKSGDLSPLLRGTPPEVLRHDQVFIAVDYAEARIEPLLALFDAIARFGGPYVRVLLLSRAAGQWWRDLPSRKTEGLFAHQPVRLSNLVETFDARELTHNAYLGFRGHLLGDGGPVPEAVTDSVAGHETVLGLHVLALGAVLYEQEHGRAPGAGEAVLSDPLRGLLHHELEVWTGIADRRGLLDGLSPELARLVLLTPTVVPARDADQARTALAAVPGFTTREPGELGHIADLLAEVYPSTRPGSPRFWDSLQPDRLGETLLADLLDTTGVADVLCAMTACLDAEQAVQPVTVAARAAGMFTSQPNGSAGPVLDLLERLLEGNPEAFLPAVVAVATSLPDPEDLCALAEEALTEVGLEVLHRTAAHFLPSRTVMSDLAVQVWAAIAEQTAQRGAFQVQNQIALIDAQQNMAFFLSNAGDHEDAIAIGEGVLKMATLLGASLPMIMDVKLASICTVLARSYTQAGRLPEAVGMAEAAVVANRTAADRDPAGNTISLAGALNNLASIQAETGQARAAAMTARDAISCFLELVRRDPDQHRIELDSALRNLRDIVHAEAAPVVAAQAWAAADEELRALGQPDVEHLTLPAHWAELPGGRQHMSPKLSGSPAPGFSALTKVLQDSTQRTQELMAAGVRMLVPIGHPLGVSLFSEEIGDQSLRIGTDIVELNYAEFGMWGMVAQDLRAERGPATRRSVEQMAEQFGMEDTSLVMDGLLNDRLVVEVPVLGPDAVAFAATHRVHPLAWGFGLDISAGGACQLGHPASPNRVYVGWPIYLVWALSPAYPDLWSTVRAVWREHVAEFPPEDLGMDLDEERLLAVFLISLPMLLGHTTAYVDRVG